MRLPLPAAARHVLLRLAAVPLVLVVAGCSTQPEPPASPGAVSAGPVQVGAAAASTPAAELQAGLTALLVERAYLVAAATDAVAAAAGQPSPQAEAALAVLDANSAALADLLGATYSGARSPLLEALRRDDELVARHAAALAAGDAERAGLVQQELESAQAELARVVRRVVPTLDADEVAARLAVDLHAQLAVGSYDGLRRAARESAQAAGLLAAGIADDRDLGSSGTAAGRLRADLTGLLTEHVLLTSALARELRRPGVVSASAQVALAANATELADALGAVYPAVRGPFLQSWRTHLDRLEAYAAARAAGAPGTGERMLLADDPAGLARLLSRHVAGLPAQSARAELTPALEAQLAAMDAAAAMTAAAPAAMREAVAQVLPAAALLSAAVAEDLQLS